eukprot:365053-Chlamydomonas_euryale.AAC.18
MSQPPRASRCLRRAEAAGAMCAGQTNGGAAPSSRCKRTGRGGAARLEDPSIHHHVVSQANGAHAARGLLPPRTCGLQHRTCGLPR